MADLLVKLYELPPLPPFLERVQRSGIVIRRALPLEKRRILRWLERQPDFPEAWMNECDVALSQQPATCFVAVRTPAAGLEGYAATSDELLGFACYDATALGFFGPEGVSAGERGGGIGSALLLSCLHAMYTQGYGYAIIGWAGPVDFYRRTVGASVIEGSEPGVYRHRLAGE